MLNQFYDQIYLALPTILLIVATATATLLGSSIIEPKVAGRPRLIHLTTRQRAKLILVDYELRGRVGIFAVPMAVGLLPPAVRSLVTFLPRERTGAGVRIPTALIRFFRRVRPLGPYSGLKFILSNHFAPFRTMRLPPRHPTPVGVACHVRSCAWVYGPDMLVWTIIATCWIGWLF